MGLRIFYIIFLDIPAFRLNSNDIHIECEIFHGILLVPQNIVMDLNDVMTSTINTIIVVYKIKLI